MTKKLSLEVMPLKIYEKIVEELRNVYHVEYETRLFAVRSSAAGEDSEEMSAAGQMKTYLGVKGLENIATAVMKCWASQFHFIAVEYKRGYGQLINSPMAVVIQEMVNCDSAGVMFTCDPYTGDERKIVITSNYGLGETVVSAESEPDTVELSVDLSGNSPLKSRKVKGVEKVVIGSKSKCIKVNDEGEGTIEVDMKTLSNKCSISEEFATELGNIGLTVRF